MSMMLVRATSKKTVAAITSSVRKPSAVLPTSSVFLSTLLDSSKSPRPSSCVGQQQRWYQPSIPAHSSNSFVTNFDLPDPTTGEEEVDEHLIIPEEPSPPPISSSSKKTAVRKPFVRQNKQLTKIVATIGPTSEQLEPMTSLVDSGLSVMRLNFSHATVDEVELRCKNLHLAQCKKEPHAGAERSDVDVHMPEQHVRAILLDTRGPEIRTGKLRNDHSGHETITLVAGNTINLHTAQIWADNGSTETDLFIDYPSLHISLDPGMKVLLDDGAITLTVRSVEKEKEFHGSVVCTIDNTGDLRSRAGVNLPGAETDLPAMSDKDKVDIKYGMTKDVDYIAASFIQNAEGVRQIRRYLKDCARDLGWDTAAPLPLIISKIESVSALQNFDEILAESDGIMVARGDLGVEIPIQQVTNAQKEMVAACNAVGKPVIVATQMLESMAKNPRPTRAEVADVTNAVYDGADCVMLSGETAKGKYPVETLKMMNEIISGAETFVSTRPDLDVGSGRGIKAFAEGGPFANSSGAAIAKAAVAAAAERQASAIIVLTSHGTLPRLVSAYRPHVPIVTICPSGKIARQLMLHRGIHPVVSAGGVSPGRKCPAAILDAKAMGYIKSGDDIIFVGIEKTEELGNFAVMKVATVP
uniref:Pyruvate kinase n=1 Tax=Ditylum brightwellii TaxID=49249 RepID=A0A6U3Z1Y0_9STRA|mmetsp:Transcript_11554/g.17214  ORF Transcript_11554/g.17214 Transcript_11554/m.17214 type:complete len:640 (+) Transcript_11554:120-2039(+)